MKLKEIAHSRTGDKGNISTISVIAYKEEDYEILKDKITAKRVLEYYSQIAIGPVERYELPNISALNFVVHNALGGGVTRSLRIDKHGKTLGSYLMDMEI